MALIVAQLRQGITPEKVALTLALGFALGIFPIIGASTVLCLLAGVVLKLNQPLMLVVNSFTVPLQPLLVPVFVRIGEHLLHAPPVTFSIPELFHKFFASPVAFLREFGLTGLHGIFAWVLIAPFVIALVTVALRPPLKKLASAFRPKPASDAATP